MRFARHLDLPFLGRVAADLVATDDWTAMLTSLKNAENDINVTLDTLDRDTLNRVHDGVSKISENTEKALGMLQTAQENIKVRHTEAVSSTHRSVFFSGY
jgi:ribosomal protein L30/L7E